MTPSQPASARFEFPIDVPDVLAERARQMVAWGIARQTVSQVGPRIATMWADGPAGWAYEWSRAAQSMEAKGSFLQAALLYGAAKFPCIVSRAQERAYARQLACFRLASGEFTVPFWRDILLVGNGDAQTKVAVHRYGARVNSRTQPLLCLTGGVDTLKVELHRLASLIARATGFEVVAFDMPGTGESMVALSKDSDWIYRAVLQSCGGAHRRKGIFGLSFGGHWAAKLALRGDVDFAVDLGGPIAAAASDGALLANLPNGMTGIVANAMRLAALPTPAMAATILEAFSLDAQGLLTPQSLKSMSPLLAINGDDDPYVRPDDSLLFHGGPQNTVWLVPSAGHCAERRLRLLMPAILMWLRVQAYGTWSDRLAYRAASALLRPWIAGKSISA